MSSQVCGPRRKELSVLGTSHAANAACLSPLKEVTAMPTARYAYRPLNKYRKEIRVLTLEPGHGDQIIRCTLSHAFLDECPIPHYETISYTCGDPALRSRIILHDNPTDVLASSAVVLRRMRRPTAQRVLWVDSICIDQENTAERGHQVGMMYEIYANTSRNLVWLGPDDEHTEQAIVCILAILNEMAKECNGVENLGTMLCDLEAMNRFSDKSLSLSHTNHEKIIVSLVHFFDSPWFDRLWVVQEVSLAPKSMCYRGKHKIPILDILRVAHLIRMRMSSSEYTPRDYRHIGHASFICKLVDREHGDYWQFEEQTSFLGLLTLFRGFETSDPRDHIFALLGLWRQQSTSTDQSTLLNPDYSLRVCEVFQNATRCAFRDTEDLGALDSVYQRDHDFGKWPSWVPRWDHEFDFDTDPGYFSASFHSDNDVKMSMIDCVDHAASLCVHGLVFDVVAEVLPAWNIKTTARSWRKRLAKIEAQVEALPCNNSWIRCPIGNVEAKVASTLSAGGALSNFLFDDQEALERYRAYKQHLTAYQKFPSVDDASTDQERLAGRFGSMSNAAMNRAVFSTEDGHIGLGPQITKSGDLLVILYGSQYPAVLRPHHEDKDCFFFVGLAYVYGIMDGEAVREYKARGVEDTLFCII